MIRDYTEGSIIEYRTFTGGIRRVEVLERCDDVKNGRPGFDGFEVQRSPADDTTGVWGYDDQITRVVRR
jgi:hypothetical protein